MSTQDDKSFMLIHLTSEFRVACYWVSARLSLHLRVSVSIMISTNLLQGVSIACS